MIISSPATVRFNIETREPSEGRSPAMVFAANPLSLSVPDAAFESWLRNSGYLEVLDERAAAADPSSPPFLPLPSTSTAAGSYRASSLAAVLSSIQTLTSIFTLNPFARLTTDDFAGPAPSWTLEFVGEGGLASYSFPPGPSQARMRVHENVRRYARNYTFLSLLIFVCFLYRMPIALLGLVSSLALWEFLRVCSVKLGLEEKYPGINQALVRIAQFATAVVLYLCNLQLAIFCATGLSYAVMIFHAAFRKLSPVKQSASPSKQRRLQPKKFQFSRLSS